MNRKYLNIIGKTLYPGNNNHGMVAWKIDLKTPEYPKGREIVVIANDEAKMSPIKNSLPFCHPPTVKGPAYPALLLFGFFDIFWLLPTFFAGDKTSVLGHI